jgi:hypothetical protein
VLAALLSPRRTPTSLLVRLLEQETEPVDGIALQVLCDVDVDGLGRPRVLVAEDVLELFQRHSLAPAVTRTSAAGRKRMGQVWRSGSPTVPPESGSRFDDLGVLRLAAAVELLQPDRRS